MTFKDYYAQAKENGGFDQASIMAVLGNLQASGLLTEAQMSDIEAALGGVTDPAALTNIGAFVNYYTAACASGDYVENTADALAIQLMNGSFEDDEYVQNAAAAMGLTDMDIDPEYLQFDGTTPGTGNPAQPGSTYDGLDTSVRDTDEKVTTDFISARFEAVSLTTDDIRMIMTDATFPLADINSYGDEGMMPLDEQMFPLEAIDAIAQKTGGKIDDVVDLRMLYILQEAGLMDDDAIMAYADADADARAAIMAEMIPTWLDDPDAGMKQMMTANLTVQSMTGYARDGHTMDILDIQSIDVLLGNTADGHINTFYFNTLDADSLVAADKMLESMLEDGVFPDEDAYLEACESWSAKMAGMVVMGNNSVEMVAATEAMGKEYYDEYGESPDEAIKKLCEEMYEKTNDPLWEYETFMYNMEHPDEISEDAPNAYRRLLVNGEFPDDMGVDEEEALKIRKAYRLKMAENIVGEYDPLNPEAGRADREANAAEANGLMREALMAGIQAFRSVLAGSAMGQKLLMMCNNFVHQPPINGTLFQEIWDLEDGAPANYELPEPSYPQSTPQSKPEPNGPSETPESSDPESSDPESSDPESSDPESSDPESSDPESSDPESSDPGDSEEPDSSEPDSSEPDSSEPSDPSDDPSSDDPSSDDPSSDDPSSDDPSSDDPSSDDPSSDDPSSDDPSSDDPSSDDPSSDDPSSDDPSSDDPESEEEEDIEDESVPLGGFDMNGTSNNKDIDQNEILGDADNPTADDLRKELEESGWSKEDIDDLIGNMFPSGTGGTDAGYDDQTPATADAAGQQPVETADWQQPAETIDWQQPAAATEGPQTDGEGWQQDAQGDEGDGPGLADAVADTGEYTAEGDSGSGSGSSGSEGQQTENDGAGESYEEPNQGAVSDYEY